VQSENKSGLDLLDEKIEAFGFEALTSSEQWFYAACWFIRETNCNAIHGYFFNHAGAHCKLALTGFQTIGARRTAEILRRAIYLFPDGNVPADHAERQGALGDLGEDVDSGGEGMVVKPIDFIAKGRRGLVQPAVKCRGREYLRINHGPEYTAPENRSASAPAASVPNVPSPCENSPWEWRHWSGSSGVNLCAVCTNASSVSSPWRANLSILGCRSTQLDFSSES